MIKRKRETEREREKERKPKRKKQVNLVSKRIFRTSNGILCFCLRERRERERSQIFRANHFQSDWFIEIANGNWGRSGPIRADRDLTDESICSAWDTRRNPPVEWPQLGRVTFLARIVAGFQIDLKFSHSLKWTLVSSSLPVGSCGIFNGLNRIWLVIGWVKVRFHRLWPKTSNFNRIMLDIRYHKIDSSIFRKWTLLKCFTHIQYDVNWNELSGIKLKFHQSNTELRTILGLDLHVDG